MIKFERFLILSIQILTISSAPLQLQYQSQLSLQPTQEELLQQQLLALQQFQNMQIMNEWGNYYPPAVLQNQAQPMMILLPESLPGWAQMNNEFKNHINFQTKTSESQDKVTNDEDSDSVIIEADQNSEPKPEPTPKKALLLVPNTRTFTIGGIISAIPFLPIEINVPDTVSWIYNGISGIISGIGNRFPIIRPILPSNTEEDKNMRLLIKRLQNQNPKAQAPILMLPDVAQVYPMPIAMRF